VNAVTVPTQLTTRRLRLRRWTDDDRDNFARLNTDPEVSHDLGGPLSRVDSDRKLNEYVNGFERLGYSRWLIEVVGENGPDVEFIGYAGVHAHADVQHPLGLHSDIGWRLTRRAWGHGYATEAARAALADVFSRIGLHEVLSYTAPDNHRSRAVMKRLNLVRDESRDFTALYPEVGAWTGIVWIGTATSV